MFCIHCGAALPDGTRFCTACGKPVEPAADARQNTTQADDFPDFEKLAKQPQDQPPADFELPPRGVDSAAPDPVSQTIREHIAPPPHYDDLDEIDPYDEPPRRTGLVVSIVAAVLIVAAVVIALVKFQPWTLLAGMDSPADTSAGEALDRSPDGNPNAALAGEEDGDEAGETVDWRDFDGAWEADGLIFMLETLDGEVNVTLHSLGDAYWDAAEAEGDTIDVRLNGMDVRLKVRKGHTLRIAIDGERFDAVRYTGKIETKDEPPAVMTGSDSGYLYYSASTGTRSANDVLPEDSSLHFWPLDQFAIAASDLDRLTQNEIDIIRNEAFARHGYVFTTAAWQQFFGALDWYTPDPTFTESRFSKLEKQNIDVIVAYEKEKGWL